MSFACSLCSGPQIVPPPTRGPASSQAEVDKGFPLPLLISADIPSERIAPDALLYGKDIYFEEHSM